MPTAVEEIEDKVLKERLVSYREGFEGFLESLFV